MEHTILIIDSHPVYADKLEGYLRGLTFHNIERASTGQDGLSRLQAWAPDVVIVSALLPDLDSGECCARIRQVCRSARIIVQTGLFFEEDEVRYLESCGADAVLTRKEKDLVPFRQVFERLLERKSAI